jgi:hypothetical protein
MPAPKIAQVRMIQFQKEEIGMGFNSESGLAVGTPLEAFTVQEDKAAPGQVVSSSVTIVTTHEELMSTMNMSFAAQGRYGFYSGSAKAEFSDSSNFNSTSTFVVARCVVENPLKRGRDFRVKPQAQALLDSNRFDEFTRAFGDSFVRGLQTGGEFYSVIRITSVSTTHQSSLAASLQAEANGLAVSGSFKASFNQGNSDSSTKSEFVATMFQMAGAGPSISPVAEIGDVIARFKSFPSIVASAPVAYETEVVTYDTLPLPLPTPEEQEDFLLAMADAREKKLTYIQARNDVEFALKNPEFFEGLPGSDVLSAVATTYTRLINAVMDHAIKLSRGQIKPPRLFEPTALAPPIVEPAPVVLRRAAAAAAVPTIQLPNMVGISGGDIELVMRGLVGHSVDEVLAGNVFLDQDNQPMRPAMGRAQVELFALAERKEISIKVDEGDVTVVGQFPFAGTVVAKGSEVVLQTRVNEAPP